MSRSEARCQAAGCNNICASPLQASATRRQTSVVKALEARVRRGEAAPEVLASEQSALAAMTEQLTGMTTEFRTLYRGCVDSLATQTLTSADAACKEPAHTRETMHTLPHAEFVMSEQGWHIDASAAGFCRVLGGITGRKKRVTTRTLPRKKAARRAAIGEDMTPEEAAAAEVARVCT